MKKVRRRYDREFRISGSGIQPCRSSRLSVEWIQATSNVPPIAALWNAIMLNRVL